MLVFDGNTFTIDGVTVFSDHADKERSWYLPRSYPELARRGPANQPNFSLVTYRPATANDPNVSGGGFLMLESILPLPDDTRDRIIARLRSMGAGNPVLSPVPLDDGSVRIIALDVEGGGGTANTATDGGLRFVESIMGATKPSMSGDNNAIFSLNLSQEGAVLMQRIFEEGANNIGVIYSFIYTGLRPALSVEITANFKRVYDHLSIGVDLNAAATVSALKFAFDADIDLVFEKLVQDGVIEIKVINFSDATDRAAKELWALDFFKNELMKEWFEPTLGLTKPVGEEPQGNGGAGGNPADAAAAAAGAATGAAAAAVRGNRGANAASPARRSVPSPMSFLPGAGDAARPAPSPAPGADTAAPDAAADGDSAEGDGQDADGETDAASGTSGPFEISLGFKLKKVHQIEDKNVTLRYDRQEAVQRSHLPQGPLSTLAGRLSGPPFFIEVDLNHGFFRTLNIAMDCPVDYDAIGLLKSDVLLEYGRPTHPAEFQREELSFAKGGVTQQNRSFFLNENLDLVYRAGTQFHFDPGSGWEGRTMLYDFPAEETIDQTLLINPWTHLGFLEITILPGLMDPVMLRHTEVTLTYAGGGWNTRKVFMVRPDDGPQSWKLRLDDPTAKTFGYAMVHHMSDGSTRPGDAGETEMTTLLVDDPFDSAISVEFWPNFDPALIQQVFLQITYSDPVNNYERSESLTFSNTAMQGQKLRLARFDDGPEEISIRAMVIGVDNAVTRHATVSTSAPFIALSELMV